MALRDEIDDALAALWTHLVNRQNTYFANKGKYWQGLRTHVIEPADGEAVAPVKSTRPTDQAESWADLAINLPATMKFALQVDVYNSPNGHGWVATVWVRINGRTWTRSRGVGPERERWQDVDAEGNWTARGWQEVTNA